jgi:hypothetical protein
METKGWAIAVAAATAVQGHAAHDQAISDNAGSKQIKFDD